MSNYKRPAGEYRRPVGRIDLASEPGLLHDRPSYVVGTTYHQKSLRNAARSRRDTLEVELVPEPGNPYDGWAVAVDIDGVRCGYLKSFVAARWHDIIRHYNRHGRAVFSSGVIECYGDGYSLYVQLPAWQSWEMLVRDLGLGAEANATIAALTEEVRQRSVQGAWDSIASADVDELRRHAHLHPSLSWDTAAGPDGDDRIPEVISYRLREMLSDAREAAREERAERARIRREEREAAARARQQRREERDRKWDERRSAVVALWDEGLSKAVISRQLKVSESTVTKLLREAGAPERAPSDTFNKEARTARQRRALEALALQRDGHARRQIAAQMGLSMESVKELLSDAKFYEDPESVPDRRELAAMCARDRALGQTRAQMTSAYGVSPGVVIRALRDADALELDPVTT